MNEALLTSVLLSYAWMALGFLAACITQRDRRLTFWEWLAAIYLWPLFLMRGRP